MVKSLAAIVTAAAFVTLTGFVHVAGATSTTTTSCVDGRSASQFTAKWSSNASVTVAIKDQKKLCNDVTIYMSSFVMPSTWDGKGFNETAIPQTLNISVNSTLKAGTSPTVTLTVPMPDKCKNVQTDVYYGPEQTSITATNKIGSRLIGAQHTKAVGTCETGGQGGATPTPTPTPTPVTPEVLPSALPSTGAHALSSILATVLISGAAYATARQLRK